MQHSADVSVILKEAEGGGGGLRTEQAGCGKKEEDDAAQQGSISEDVFAHDKKPPRRSTER
jgi:hypothetical protein